MNRSSIKALGLLLLVPSAFIGLLPLIADRTTMLSDVGDATWAIGSLTLVRITQGASATSVEVSPWVWVLAAAGELLLMSIAVLRPVRTSRWVITHRS